MPFFPSLKVFWSRFKAGSGPLWSRNLPGIGLCRALSQGGRCPGSAIEGTCTEQQQWPLPTGDTQGTPYPSTIIK